MAVGEIITVARYNQMQAKAALVLGNGSGQNGYGETLDRSQVSTADTVNAVHMQNLKSDLTNARVHQTGTAPTLTNVSVSEDITDSVYAQYEGVSTDILNDANDIFESTQASVESKISSTRTTTWGGASQPQGVVHEFSVIFNDADHRRHFFNAGGEVRFTASLTGGSGAKYTEWNTMLAALGTVKFTSTNLTADSGTSSGLGNFELTETFQTLLTKTGSGVYAENDYTIKGRASGATLYFRVEFNDDARGSGGGGFGGLDDSVTGTLVSTISQLRATGAYVEVATPSYLNTQQLT